MSLFIINCAKGWDSETKDKIRTDIACNMGELNHISDKFMAVLFNELEPENMSPNHGCFILVYLSEGRSDAFKDQMVTILTEAITSNTDYGDDKVAIMINDVLKGNMATKGKIVNRGGAVAQLLQEGKIGQDEL